jgi:hypothetical protein
MATTYTITIDDYKNKGLETEFLDPQAHFNNFVNHRYKLIYDGMLPELIKHCNDNSISLAVGESAQIDQAYSVGILSRADETYTPIR